MNLRGRVGRLEGRAALRRCTRERCDACGAAPADPVVYSCEQPRVIGEDAGTTAGQESCPGCGRVLVYRCAPPRELAPVAGP